MRMDKAELKRSRRIPIPEGSDQAEDVFMMLGIMGFKIEFLPDRKLKIGGVTFEWDDNNQIHPWGEFCDLLMMTNHRFC